MNRYTSPLFGCGFTLSLLLPAFAAPSLPVPPASDAAPSPASARAFLKKSAAAYVTLKSFSVSLDLMSNVTTDKKGERTKLKGSFALKRPGQSYLSLDGPNSFYRSVQDGKNIYTQQDAKIYQVADSPKEMGAVGALASRPSYSLLVAASLIDGMSPFADQKGARMKLATVNGLPQVSIELPAASGMNGASILLEFNPQTKLLRRSEVKLKGQNYFYHDSLLFSEAKLNPKLDAKLFTFVPRAGAKRVDAPHLFDPSLKVGGQPHEISGRDLRGETISLKNYKGKVVLIDFWATWCGPCVAEIPNMLAAYKKYHAKGFEILSISTDETKEAVEQFVAARKLPWTQIWDKDCMPSPNTLYKVTGIPFLLLVGKDGKIAAINPRGEALAPAVKAALAR